MSQRLTSLAVLLLLMLTISACSATSPTSVPATSPDDSTPSEVATTDASSSAEADTSGPAQTKVLIIGHHTEPTTLNQFNNTTAAHQSTMAATIEQFVYFTPDGSEIVPGLAESWEYKDDGKTLEIKLKEGVKFHNGEELNADCAKLSIELLRDSNWYAGWNDWFLGADVVDKYTIDVRFSEPEGSALAVLARGGFVYPAKYFNEVGAEAFAQAPVGTGPYEFVEWKKGDRIVLKAFPDYYGGQPNLDSIIWRFIPELSARIAALQTTEVRLITNVAPSSLAQLEGEPGVEVVSTDGLRMFTTFFDSRLDHPIANQKVRQALNYAVDKQALVALFDGQATPLKGQYLPSMVPGWNPDVNPYDYDPEKAKALLAEAGYADGFDLDFKYTTDRYPLDREMGEAVAGYLTAVGVRVNSMPLEYGEFLRQWSEEESMGPTWQWGLLLPPDPHMALGSFLSSGRYDRWPFNQEVEDLLNAGHRENDTAKRAAIYQELLQLWNEDPIGIYLIIPKDNYAQQNTLKGFVPRVDQVVNLTDVDIVE